MVCLECECWTYINCIMSAVLWVGPYHRSVMESFHLELVWVMASFLPEQNMGRAASFSVYHCPVGQSLDPSSPATIKNPLKGAPLIVTVNLKQINRFKKASLHNILFGDLVLGIFSVSFQPISKYTINTPSRNCQRKIKK